MTGQDNRSARRYDVDVTAEVTVGNRVIPVRTKNLSETGVCLVSSTPLSEGSRLDLSLFLTVDGIEDADSPPLDVGASVIWASPGNENDHLAGCQFSGLDGSKTGILQGFLGKLEE